MTEHSTRRCIAACAMLAMALAGCGAAKDKAVDQALKDSGVELNDLGTSLPDSFPAEVPVPTNSVELETAVATGETFAMRYGVDDPGAAVGSYRSALESAGFTIEIEFDNLDETANNVGFTATNGIWEITSSAFGEDPVDGLYMGVTVMPAS